MTIRKNALLLLTTLFFAYFTTTLLAQQKPRLIVTTDIGSGDPDDRQSMVRLLVYANEFDIEGLIAVWAGAPQGPVVRPDLIREQINAYAKVYPNLAKQASGYPLPEKLLQVTKAGWVHKELRYLTKDSLSEGARLIIQAADKPDARPLWITVWGGSFTLAEALNAVKTTRSPTELKTFVSKLRVYAISDQDETGPWLRREFSDLFYIVTPSNPNQWQEYYRATWSGISGDRFFDNGPYSHFNLVDSVWLDKNIRQQHGTLGDTYPQIRFIMEGDSPSFMGLIDNGLGWAISPAYGGWGGRYGLFQPASETHPIWTNSMRTRDRVSLKNGGSDNSDPATIWRWRQHFQNDFAARMDWCTTPEFRNVNHNPRAVLNRDTTKNVHYIPAKPGGTVALTSAGTTDPDQHRTVVSWWIYEEASSIKKARLSRSTGTQTNVLVPATSGSGTVHVIMEVKDTGSPTLWSYRRVVIQVN